MRKCLLIKTPDKRKFLIWKKDLKSIMSFAKAFKAKIFTAELKESSEILDYKKLAKVFCDPNYNNESKVEILERIYPRPQKNRKSILEDAKKINEFIKNEMLDGKPVSLKQLKSKYNNCNVTDACLCNHLSNVRKELVKEGHEINKLGAGKYAIVF